MAGLPTIERADETGVVNGEALVNGVRLAYRFWRGPVDASHPPVVLLHGLLQTGEGMAHLAGHLARRGPVLVPDLRGRGGSEQPVDGYDPATMADDVAALLDSRGVRRPVAIGRLHGGLVAYHLAARHPYRSRGLVLGDTAPEVSAERAERERTIVRRLPARFGSADEAQEFYERVLGLSPARARHDIPSDLVADDAGGFRWRHNLDLIARIEDAAAPRSDWDTLARVSCPTLLLRGQRGEVPAEMADRFCQAIGGCQVQTVLGARHDVFLGPGAEQSFGAIELFLMRLADDALPLPLPITDAHPATFLDPIERMVAAINARDDAAISSLCAESGRMRQFLPDGSAREGGPELAREAFWNLLDAYPEAVVEVRQAVVADDQAAALLAIRSFGDGDEALLLPVFLTLERGRIASMTVVGYRRSIP
ncbi:MAG TPA: alpha/beta fold hydrolase [Thermomicrobiales bacterium]|nr:alpha/beta fold hydrolase [Thermomicrobiales bacterium]